MTPVTRLLASVLVVASLYSCGQGSPVAAATPAASCASSRSADAMYQQWQAKNDLVWSGSDQMTSYRASSGTVYWLTGDYVSGYEDQATGGYAPGWAMAGHSNTILMQQGCTITRAHPGEQAVPDQNGWRHWAHTAVESGSSLYVLAQRVRGGVPFEVDGVTIARFPIQTSGKLSAPVLTLAPAGPIQWAGAVTVIGTYAFIYGYAGTDNPWLPQQSYLARVPVSQFAATSLWRYWSGTAWSTNVGAAAPIRDCQISSAAVFAGKTVVVCKPWHGADGPNHPSNVEAHTASNPWGPFTTSVMFTSPRGTFQGVEYQTYQPMLHQWASLTSGKTLVSINRNHVDHLQLGSRADLYKPMWFEVTL